MLTRTSLVRTAQVLFMGATVTLASTALAAPASAATLNVACTQAALQAAITTANGTTASDTLNLAPGCTYQLTAELPAITTTVLINGNGATINRQSGTFRILTVNGGNLTLRTATLSNGDAGGSPIATDAGGLSVFSGSLANVGTSTFRSNIATQNGGGIVSDGTVNVTASQITANQAAGAGGGIAHIGTLSVRATSITGNTATFGGGLANGVPAASGGTAVHPRSGGCCGGSQGCPYTRKVPSDGTGRTPGYGARRSCSEGTFRTTRPWSPSPQVRRWR